MNFFDAVKAMRGGEKAKRPGFIHWCYIDHDSLLFETGFANSYYPSLNDLLATDWGAEEIKKNKLSFGEAIKWINDEHKLSRACWKNPDIYIYIRKDPLTTKADEIRVITVLGLDCPWMPNHQELLANDWQIVGQINE